MKERAVLDRIFAAGSSWPGVSIGPGDDMAMVDLPEGLAREHVLVAVDQVIDGIHVDVRRVELAAIGHKAVARSLSDVAAMAGRPLACLVSAVVPVGWADDEAMELFEGMQTTALAHRAPIIGGDLSAHRDPASPLVCSVTVLATPTENGPVQRFGARVGDVICVSGRLGGAVDDQGGGRHLSFDPRIGEAIMLHAVLGERLHAMIDLSDGLGTDAAHMLDRDPGLQIQLEADAIPSSAGLGWRRAVSDGEDYELCFCAEGTVPQQVLECPISIIGRVVERCADDQRRVIVLEDGTEHDITNAGWEHAT